MAPHLYSMALGDKDRQIPPRDIDSLKAVKCMGKTDTTGKTYLGRPDIFADIFNQYLFDGEQRIDPASLKPADTTAALMFDKASPLAEIQKQRDVFKYAVCMSDDQAVYLMLGIENQANIHYAMPIKNLLYDAAEYQRQIEAAFDTYDIKAETAEEIAVETANQRGRKRKPKLKMSNNEYLSRFRKDDKLIPVITLVVYYGTKLWDGPRSLHEMLSTTDPEILKFVPDYKINLISLVEMNDDEIEEFKTSFKTVAKFVRLSKNRAELMEFVQSSEEFKNFDRDAARLLSAITGNLFTVDNSKGGVDVCDAIIGLVGDAKQEGRREGEIKATVETGKTLGATMDAVINMLVERLSLSMEEAAAAVRAIW